jgi:glycosyltransferase involved in cell wall biosynthesis
MAGPDLGSRILMPGRVAPSEVADYLAAFDVASLPQSVDGVGSFRYSTKLSEYLASGLPIVTGQIPAAYDLDAGCFWRLPGRYPWSSTYEDALVSLLESLSRDEIARRREAIGGRGTDLFDRAAQQRRVSEFVREILSEAGR